MNPIWRQELQHEIQKYEENVFATLVKLKEKFECFVGPCEMPIIQFFCALMDHHFKGTYQRFVHELNLTQMSTQSPTNTSPSTMNEYSASDEEIPPSKMISLSSQSRCNNVSTQKNQIQKRKHSPEKPKSEELVKRSKPVSVIPSTSLFVNMDPVAVQTVQKLKNTDKMIHSLHGFNTFKCVLCSQTSAQMVKHYVSNHPGHEVFISRLSPEMAALAKQHRRVKMSDNFCYFCGKIMENVSDWEKHILDHTGELPYQCIDCKKSLASIEAHANCSSEFVSDVFEMNSPNSDLKAFLCNLCNFIQIDKERLVNHLMREHQLVIRADLLNEMVSITLRYNCSDDAHHKRNDENHLNDGDNNDQNAADGVVVEEVMDKVTPTIRHVDASILYRCGVADCKFIAGKKNDKDFIQHLRTNHSENDSFQCTHCPNGTSSARMDVKNAFYHTVLHGDHFYKCNACDHICPREFLINLHILRLHPNEKFTFKHTNRSNDDASEDVTFEFACNVCDERLNVVADLAKHFQEMHKSVIIDCKAIRKSSQSDDANQMTLLFQQRWLCLPCNRMHSTKSNLIEHRKQKHPSDPLEMQISRIVQIEAAKFPDYLNFKEQNDRFDRYLLYCCAHCHDTEYTDIYRVHQHWKQIHASEAFVPFRFESAALVKCHACKIISTFDGLKSHYESKHPQLKLVVNDLLPGGSSFSGGKCGLCNYNGSNIIGHFAEHDLIVQNTDVVSPIPIDDATLQQVQTIQIEKQKQCFYCKKIFETISALEFHHVEEHAHKEMLYEDYNGNISPFLIAGCCKKQIGMDEFIDHMHNHKTPISCQLCTFQAIKLIDLVKHDVMIHNAGQDQQFRLQCLLRTFHYQTRVVFGNGFIIAKANLIGTRFDDTNKLDEFHIDGPTKRRSIII